MKTILNLATILILITISSSCQTKKITIDKNNDESSLLYKQALQSLNNCNFIIEANEFYYPSGKSLTDTSSGNYISMQNRLAVIKFTPNIFPNYPWSHLIIEDSAAELIKGKSKKNGDLQFVLTLNGSQEWLRRKISIRVYKNTNICFIQVNSDDGTNIINLKGYIYPKKSE